MKKAELDPVVPSRADYRFLRRILTSLFGVRVVHCESEYRVILRAFEKAGGSWEKLYLGSFEEIRLLKRLAKAAWSSGRISRTDEWR